MFHTQKERSMRRIRMIPILACLWALVVPVAGPGAEAERDDSTKKEQALEAFADADYPLAVRLMKEARQADPEDAEIPYYLGYFYHYLCYDSAPLPGCGREDSDLVISNLEEALEMDPGLGDARYFLGAEYGVRARQALAGGKVEEAQRELKKGREKGGYPPWLLEYGRNMLRSCGPDAILITGGDADTNPVLYLQVVEGFRRDVTTLPYGLLDRPWFAGTIKEGIDGVIPPVSMNWTDWQIMDMHPYKWRSLRVDVPVDPGVADEYGLQEHSFSWVLEPDLGEGRLSASGALMVEIIRANFTERPVHFSLGCSEGMFHGLGEHLRISGLCYRLLPVRVGGGGMALDLEATGRILMDEGALGEFASYSGSPMPRASPILHNYRAVLLTMVQELHQSGDDERARGILDAMEERLPESVLSSPQGVL